MSVNDQSTRTVVFSQAQGYALSKLFEGQLSRDKNRRAHYADVSERLSDSLWMARWLRENVSLELQSEEIISLLDEIITVVNEHRCSDEDCRALEGVIHQLPAAPWTPSMVDNVVPMPSAAIVP